MDALSEIYRQKRTGLEVLVQTKCTLTPQEWQFFEPMFLRISLRWLEKLLLVRSECTFGTVPVLKFNFLAVTGPRIVVHTVHDRFLVRGSLDKPFISSDSAVNARNFGVRSVILSLLTFQLVNSTFFDFSFRSISSFSPCVTHKTEFPLELFRAVRPAR